MRRLFGRALISMAAAVVAAAFLAPGALASPIGDAEAAMMAAWEKAGGDGSPLGARKGDVYPAGDGFVLDFDGGKMFYTTDTGAKFVYGPILDKYEALGGPVNSDLGFPTINEVPGLAGPDSRVATFAASDKPVIFWTAVHGAFVVRGAMNAAWDKLGSSGGVLGAPAGDETYDGEVTSQKFTGGQISWNRKTKDFTTTPPALADQLKGLQVAIDPTAAINMAWRAAGGASGPLGAKQGAQYPIGGDGVAQNFAGGKVFFSPATGASAIESDILAKYESAGGPVSSDLGFPIANESDGGIPSSRSCTFAAADKPVIFWTREHGAFVVRGAMKAAWDKLRGASGKLGAPVGDQAVDGDVISQKFAGGKISWNRAKNTFTTDPSNLAPLLSGLQVSGQNQPSSAAMPPHSKKFAWHSWYLLVIIPVAIVLALLAFLPFGLRRRRARREAAAAAAAYQHDRDADLGGYDAVADGHWGHDYGDDYASADAREEAHEHAHPNAEAATDHFLFGEPQPSEEPGDESGSRVSWSRGDEVAAEYGGESPPMPEEDADRSGIEEVDPDAVDTDSIPVVSEDVLAESDYPEAGYPEPAYPEPAYPEAAYPEAAYPEAAYPEEDEPAYLDVDEAAEAEEAEYPDVAVPHTPADAAHPDDAYPAAAPEPVDSDVVYPDVAVAHTAPDVAAPGVVAAAGPRPGRHAAVDADEGPGPAGRPTIHLPLDDPYQMPDGYPIKVNASFGLYYTPDSVLYQDTLAEIWMSSEEVAQANGFTKAD
ncbi:hypothetical protein A5745_04070 [Mycobacterium sp. IS-2888]|uniref:sunset domain-containing protein n=1 Tax=Mycobacterium sp. IS-2888 TaxID=1834159 RepID=UPI00096DE967|nr:hypothetical protein [Mycobacterium sp. IS-2888]OMC50771.1 hypothetical protein A5745_04070 [Mycobacterium sp. IS-2888]